MRLPSVFTPFSPRTSRLQAMLVEQATIVHEGARALAGFTAELEPSCLAVERLDTPARKLLHDVEDSLRATLLSTLDREDHHRLSTTLETVRVRTKRVARACLIVGLARPTPAMKRLADSLVACTHEMACALNELHAGSCERTMVHVREVRSMQKEAAASYSEALRELTGDGLTEAADIRRTMREKAVLDELHDAIEHCGHFSKIIAHVAVKIS